MSIAQIIGSRHVLAVQNLHISINYYIDQLGFSLVWQIEGWALVQRDSISIMLGECQDDISAHETNNHSYFAYIEVTDIDYLHQEFTHKNVEFVSQLATKDWGQREFAIKTIDGHRIMFGQELLS
ncbi:VOC family protein [Ekhidna sp.]|uniref:VOC family protein n=1 Tax=Ekhidna sp. TaxID=2608089 RepID=UPI003BA9BBFE